MHILLFQLFEDIKMFEDIKIEKNNFYHHKSRILLNDVDIEKLLVSKKISSSEKNYKYFIVNIKKEFNSKPVYNKIF